MDYFLSSSNFEGMRNNRLAWDNNLFNSVFAVRLAPLIPLTTDSRERSIDNVLSLSLYGAETAQWWLNYWIASLFKLTSQTQGRSLPQSTSCPFCLHTGKSLPKSHLSYQKPQGTAKRNQHFDFVYFLQSSMCSKLVATFQSYPGTSFCQCTAIAWERWSDSSPQHLSACSLLHNC